MKKLLVPTIVVIFGITGDLAQKKLLPALFDLYKKNLLPEHFKIVGFSRRDIALEDFKKSVASAIGHKSHDNDEIERFAQMAEYVRGDFDTIASFETLKKRLDSIDASWGVCTNKLLYLAVPPHLYRGLFTHIHASGLSRPCGDELGWNRILVEKPFGTNGKEARDLDIMLGKLFDERQVFRIDHYLAKETLQNILTFRFTNSLFETLWNKENIESVRISLFESNDLGERGAFYDSLGALFDVGQNHLLQMLALSAMKKPARNECKEIRKERARVLKDIVIDKKVSPIRMQYEGYTSEDKISKESQTETAFAFRAYVKNWQWRGVPFYIEAGKAFDKSFAQIEYTFRDKDPLIFTPSKYQSQEKNALVFKIQPNEGISLSFWLKVPGLKSEVEQRELSYEYADEENGKGSDAYEKVLYDCFAGDQTLFASTDELLTSWRITHDVEGIMDKTKLHKYKVGEDPEKVFSSWREGKNMI